VVVKILKAAGLKLDDVVMNNVKSGSFSVTATKASNSALRVREL
jgi:hypothetical protein